MQANHHHPRNTSTDKTYEHGAFFPHHHSSPATRVMLPLPTSKRQRTLTDKEDSSRPRLASPAAQRHARNHMSTNRDDLQEKLTGVRLTPPTTRSDVSVSMSRCHICFRKPTKKSDLDSFANCQGCGQRTCYVCIRECLGWWPPHLQSGDGRGPDVPAPGSMVGLGNTNESFIMVDADTGDAEPPTDAGILRRDDDLRSGGNGRVYHAQPLPPTPPPQLNQQQHQQQHQESHSWATGGHRQMVCSRCCIERGTDGDVQCLGCLVSNGG
ncbi:hypothetical protein B0T17DRAFT_329037 [Bombardia bombarda]|uniref:Uncharacterized protein n=1 Tax=Bombardia bombarda TaxID=252184 RepID=A0AA39WMN4_9PEZI|nr:hypothetical protein B0T17DRAFT_329037 [Bombardia bombarda]